MDISQPVGSEVSSVDFGVFSTAEIRKLSAKQITNPVVFDTLGHTVNNGLYDLALGAFLRNLCTTCGLDERFCPGHQGHIELPVPVYNPLFFNQMYSFLRASCLYCHHLKLGELETHAFAQKLRLIQYGLLLEAQQFDAMVAKDSSSDDLEGAGGPAALDAEARAALKHKRDVFVDSAVGAALAEGRTSPHGLVTEIVGEERKNTIHTFYARILTRPKCERCGMVSPTFRKDGFVKIFENALRDKQVSANRIKGIMRPDMLRQASASAGSAGENIPSFKPVQGSKYILSTEVRNILRAVFANEQAVMQMVFHSRPQLTAPVSADMFFMQALIVPPTRFRLPSKLGDEIHENAQNELLLAVLKTSLLIKDLNDQIAGHLGKQKALGLEERKLLFNRLMNAFVTIQNDVNAFIDSTKNQNTAAGKIPIPGIKQALEKKEGLFRKNMMGKRVNYAARSVISPDPNLETNEIGVPPVFAVKLTYPEPVTAYNVNELRQAVINGPDKWPGATQVQNEDGSMVSLLGMTVELRKTLAQQLLTPSGGASVVNKKVYRHIKNKDVVIMNRQPTLHKASMMGHKVRVLPGEKTLRLHYANTGAYNADFDGDEMNMHFPQNENAKAEALNLANTDSQYLTPTSGAPLRGLIQDHISAGVWLTSKDTFFNRETYQQLIYGCIRPEDGHTNGAAKILTVPPTVFKPEPLWTGKQIITTILLNIKPHGVAGVNLVSKNKVKNDYWGKGSEENTVLFRNGELLCGILDKSQYGASQYGIVHSLHEVYGPDTASKALSVLGRLFTNYTMMAAFTCGMDDLRLTAEGNAWRNEILKQSVDIGRAAACEVTNLDTETPSGNKELLKRLQEILRDDNKLGILDAITQSKVNSITSQVVNKCVPDGTMKRFPYNSMQAMALSGAKGSGVNVSQIMCLLGQQALEGRRVPVMVSGKTLPSFKPFETDARAGGYIKGRFYSGIRPQEYYFHCMAGREGLIDTAVKTSRSGYLQRCLTKQLEGIHIAYDNSVRDCDGSMIQVLYGGDAVDTTKESHMTQFKFCLDNYDAMLSKYNPGEITEHLDTLTALSYNKKERKSYKKQAKLPHFEQNPKYDPVLSVYNPSKYLGSVSEKFQDKLDDFVKENPDMFTKHLSDGITEKKFRALMQLKYMRSLVNPGESVGIVAAQSIGEPSTQMTLNTFHFAGHGAANVTLGIPRMREIIMTASASIKTPQMTLPILPDVTDEMADSFCKSVAKVCFSEFIDKVTVTEKTGVVNDTPYRSYKVKMRFFNKKEYEEEYDISSTQLQSAISKTFLRKLELAISKELKKQTRSDTLPSIGKGVPKTQKEAPVSKNVLKEEDSDDEDEDDVKNEGNGKQPVSYDGPDDEEVESMRKAEETSDEEMEGSDSGSSDSDEESDSSEEDSDDENMIDDEACESKRPAKTLSKAAKGRQDDVVSNHHLIKAYDFDDENGEWCEFEVELLGDIQKLLMVNIIEDLCRVTVVREIKNIGRCVRPQADGSAKSLTTEGVNFKAMWEQDDFIDVNGIRSNDISAVLNTYGVEAARNTIVNEVSNVFSTYAITVSTRHLDLIADMMTREGTYLAFNRQGIDSSTSAFKKMSYETTCQFLTKAVLDGDREDLDSPSARIVLGKLNGVGTGSFDVMAKMQNGCSE
ncbi:beta and beta-prime subunits of DNA dependent RNA-polymerase [Metschnikowia bicuspidata var. bicuspidata NRRL YB-4993]|uniref:DNA-directed RNA polymerase subunit n=1 Tax=Metschnikowia bicuspidata var. bicuspidata NRRL YB-4993 TaxID=869754 RepID=A0A1A0HH28_9ASCO|nr:beta and beta-prime subunits of DNA dependent RNA-polymerase [Metschnikowia bicuspidata var. bicuspidata NRRL YB-4993]OBA23182.1 beta and beta-prime subunits of DNA dependent RNA-polymerase [Metschnikowia bicuspidata var. bicuspidata NRRL YB-4993]